LLGKKRNADRSRQKAESSAKQVLFELAESGDRAASSSLVINDNATNE